MMPHYSEEAFTEIYEGQLYAIERSILKICQSHPELIDLEIIIVLEAVIKWCQIKDNGNQHVTQKFDQAMQLLLDALKEVCELLLASYLDEDATVAFTLDELIGCLKRIRSSAKFWNKKARCRQGYIQFVSQYVI